MNGVRLIILLVVTFLASGCVDNGSSTTGIAVDRLNVEPSSIAEGNTVSVLLEARNSGLLEGIVDVGEENGKEVLTNYCSDYFQIENFNAKAERNQEREQDNSYNLSDGERLIMQWRLRQEGAEVPTFGYDCDLKFEIPFNYSVTAYKQLQVLEDRSVETEVEPAEDSSAGPLSFDMELIGTSSNRKNTFLKNENVSLYITAYNRREEEDKENPFKGLIELHGLEINSNGAVDIEDEKCLDKENVALAAGDKNIYRCGISVEKDPSPSAMGEITANVDYTYVRDVNGKTLKVKPSGN